MRSSIRLGKLFGIEIGLHYSWFLIALLITMSLGSQFQAEPCRMGIQRHLGALGSDGHAVFRHAAGA